jgi:eukaryotic-like serine/threonine-protein kinase
MAPEQRAGSPANLSSDIYGAGALLWHALTGGPPDARLPFLSSELGVEHAAIARRMIGSDDERPKDSVEARSLLASVVWPRSVPAARASVPEIRATEERSLRLVPVGDAVHEDTLLQRLVYVRPADPKTLARVLPLARAGHPSLASVLAHRPEEPSVWIEVVNGGRLALPLSAEEHAALAAALESLHRAGGVHGAVDRDHVVRRGDLVMLAFALTPRARIPPRI